MTKIAVISDIHSNLEALIAVIKDIKSQGIEDIYCLGDVIGYGPRPVECFDLVYKLAKGIVSGNHEAAINSRSIYYSLNKTARLGIDFSRNSLTKEMNDIVKNLEYKIEIKEHDIVLCHGSYMNPQSFHYIFPIEDLKEEVSVIPNKICFVGHTHLPFIYGDKNGYCWKSKLVLLEDEKYIINVGSVGQPRDKDNRASYGIIESNNGKMIFSIHRCAYDIEKTMDEIYANNSLPDSLADRLSIGE